jgi:hypothetical protein
MTATPKRLSPGLWCREKAGGHGPFAPPLSGQWTIRAIENIIDFTINTRRYAMGRENTWEHFTEKTSL